MIRDHIGLGRSGNENNIWVLLTTYNIVAYLLSLLLFGIHYTVSPWLTTFLCKKKIRVNQNLPWLTL